jgi:hypothetical protein
MPFGSDRFELDFIHTGLDASRSVSLCVAKEMRKIALKFWHLRRR